MSLFRPRVFTEIFGEMSSRLLSATPLTDINYGSVWTTMLEAAAQEDDEQYFQMLEIIRGYSLDTTTGTDLDDRAFEYGLTRFDATTASTTVTLGDSSLTKISTGVYSALPGSPAGGTTINADEATGFPTSGTIIIGRGTPRVETINYSSITTYPTYVVFNLSSSLAYDHGTDETIILSQNGNRIISIGTIVYVPEGDLSARVEFQLDSTVTILDGEEIVEDVAVTALDSGAQANVPVGAISEFDSPPFTAAYVRNPRRVTNGRDVESDSELRDRIKAHVQSLSRGTGVSILNEAVKVVSEEDNKRVVSASLVEPTIPADVVKMYIDDGAGLKPTWKSVGIEEVVAAATGGEKFLRVANVPMVKAFVETQNDAPYNIASGDELFVEVGGVVETITFASTDFAAPGAATSQEVVRKINSTASLFEARETQEGAKLKIFARNNIDEQIRVTGGSANATNKFFFPTDTKFTSKLYLIANNTTKLLSKDGITATMESGLATAYDMSTRKNFVFVVDGKVHNPQVVWFDPSDFLFPPTVSSLDIVNSINEQASGVVAARSSNNTKFRLTSNTQRSSTSKLRIYEEFETIFNEESSVLVDRTNDLSSGTSTTCFGANSDYLYVGMTTLRFFTLYVEISTPSVISIAPKFEAWNPITSTWESVGAFDGTSGFQQTGHITFGRPSKWAETTVNAVTAFWFRIQRTAGAATPVTVDYVKLSNANEEFGFSTLEILGQDKDYTINRFIGQIELVTALQPLAKVSLGSDLTRAYVVNVSNAPLGLVGGEVLNIEIDGVPQTVTFQPGDFFTPGAATAAEIAQRCALDLSGVLVTTANAGSKVQITSSTWNGGTIKVTGGSANVFLQFPTTLYTSYVSHFPAVVSLAGPFVMPTSNTLVVVMDDNFANNFIVPAFKEVICAVGSTASALIDTGLSSYFPLSTDIQSYKIVMTSGAQTGSIRTVSSYVPGSGTINLSAPLAGAPAVGDTFQIIPQTAKEFVHFWNNKTITLLSTVAEISVGGGGNAIQIASLNSGEDAGVFVTGGTANLILGFSNISVQGVDGYKHYTGLVKETQWTIDGREDDQINYPGMRAAGVQVEVLEPVNIPLRVEINAETVEGVSLSSISNEIKSAVSAYVNNLKVGQDVIVSEIICAAKEVSGVFDIAVIDPPANVAVADNELIRIDESQIVVG